MLFTRSKISGIDTAIDGLQRKLYPSLVSLWKLNAASDKDYNSYARAYKNQSENGLVPEVFVKGIEYKEVMLDDKIKALSFFSIGDSISFDNNLSKAKVGLIFFVDLTKISSGQNRNDELVRQQIVKLIQGNKYFGFSFEGVEIGIDLSLKEYAGARKNIGLKYRDMHPYHCFRLNFTLQYKTNC